MKIFYTVFVKVFAFLFSFSVFFFLLIGFLTVLANKHENQIFTNSSEEVDSTAAPTQQVSQGISLPVAADAAAHKSDTSFTHIHTHSHTHTT